MYDDPFSLIVGGAVLIVVLSSIYFAQWRHRLQTKRLLILELLKRYFQGKVPMDQLTRRVPEIAGHYLMRDAQLYPLVIVAFQNTLDATIADAHRKEDETKLLGLLATVKKEFGLPDRYQIEGWRAGRE